MTPDTASPPQAEEPQALTFDQFSRVNTQRCARWHPGFPTEDSWTLADWSNALCGEAGELANVIKKIRRIDTAHFSKRADEQDRADLVRKAADEIGDVMAYLDLLATKLGLRVDAVTAAKFDAISEREGYPERLVAAPVAGTDLPELAPPTGDLLEALERSLVQARGDGLPPDPAAGEAQQ